MQTRMERYSNDKEEIARTDKNQEMYQNMYNDVPLPSSNVAVLDNESEIDISKIKELVENREGYRRVKDYQSVLKESILEDDKDEHDIYEDIDNKIYDINQILEEAKSKREPSDREKYRNLRNTQYNILSKLDLDKGPEPEEEMATDFFTQDKSMQNLITNVHNELQNGAKEEKSSATSTDLFDDLRGSDNTVLTEAISEEKAQTTKINSDDDKTFYTNSMSFTKEDFEGFQNLQTTVKKNNNLIRILIIILTAVIIAIAIFLMITVL